ncbi:hypothetical protein ACVITL_003369 [Rhizobium pisi]
MSAASTLQIVERMLTETDGPFTEGKAGPARPEDALSCLEGLAGIFGNLLAMPKKTAH